MNSDFSPRRFEHSRRLTRVALLCVVALSLTGCAQDSEAGPGARRPTSNDSSNGDEIGGGAGGARYPGASESDASGATDSGESRGNSATNARSAPPPPDSPDALLLTETYPGRSLAVACLPDEQFIATAEAAGAVRCVILYQSTGETRGAFDEAKFRANLKRVVPDVPGVLALLDFEGRWMKFLEIDDTSSEEFVMGESEYLNLLRIAREERPRAKWSVYGIPTMRYFGASTRGTTIAWNKATPESRKKAMDKGRRAQRIIDACDWVAPTIYDPYLDSKNSTNRKAGQAHVFDKVSLAVEMARGKPVMPLVWHRVHDTNKSDGLTLLPVEEFIDGQIKPALAAGAVGVVWWGADSIATGNGKLQERQPEEFAGIAPGDRDALRAYLRSMHIERLRAIETVVR